MNLTTGNLKIALLSFLKKDDNKQKNIQLDCHWTKTLQLSDHRNYFFTSRRLKAQLKNDDNIPEDRFFRVRLKKWRFVDDGVKKGKRVIDLEVDSYTIKTLKEDLDFSKRNKDIFDYADIKGLLKNRGRKTTAVKKEKERANEKVKQLRAKPAKQKKIDRKTKIKKKSQLTESPVSRKEVSEEAEEERRDDFFGDVEFIDLVKTRMFVLAGRNNSATKELRFQTPSVKGTTMNSPYNCKREGLRNITKALNDLKENRGTLSDDLPESLKKEDFSIEDYLLAANGGRISGREVFFDGNIIGAVLKELKSE